MISPNYRPVFSLVPRVPPVSRATFAGARRAFTLIQLLVTIAILTVLVGILAAGISKINTQAQLTAQKYDFQSIALALEAYKSAFYDYPKNISFLAGSSATTGTIGPLAAGIVGPGPKVTAGSPTYYLGDGAEGPGFRVTTDPTGAPAGKVWPPFIPSDKFPIDWVTLGGTKYPVFKDHWGGYIQYLTVFHPNKPGTILYASAAPITAGVAGQGSIFDTRDIVDPLNTIGDSTTGTGQAFMYDLGDENLDNTITSPESARYSGGYVLVSPGPNGKFLDFTGVTAPADRSRLVTKSVNVYNFDR